MKKIVLTGLVVFAGIWGSSNYTFAQTGGNTKGNHHQLTEAQKEALKKLKADYERKVRSFGDEIEDLIARIQQLRKSADPKNKQEIDAIKKEIRKIQREIYDAGVEFYKELVRIHKLGNSSKP